MGKPDPLAALLDSASGAGQPGAPPRVLVLFKDRPEVLASIRAARARGLSFDRIAELLSTAEAPISGGAIKNWLKRPADG